MTSSTLPAHYTEANPLFIDNSILSTVAQCSTKSLLTYHHHLTSSEPSPALEAGKAAHASLAHYFTTGSMSDSLEIFKAHYLQLGSTLDPDAALSWENTSTTMRHWFSQHDLETMPWTILPTSVERTLIAPLWEEEWGGRVQFVGLIDAIAQSPTTGHLYILDTKTTSLPLDNSWTSKFHLSSQLTGYIWLAQEKRIHLSLPDASCGEGRPLLPISSALINSIQFSRLPNSPKKCKLHSLPYSECRSFHAHSQIDGPFSRSPRQINDWLRTARGRVQKWIKLKESHPTLVTIDCADREGSFLYDACKFCPFTPYCRGAYQPHQLPSMYKNRPWEPWKEGGVGEGGEGKAA